MKPWELRIAGQRVLAGLTWVPLVATDGRAAVREFKTLLKERKQRAGALWSPSATRYPMGGIAASNGRAHEGCVPAAAWLAAAAARPTLFVGPHPMADHVWLLAAGANDIDADADCSVPAHLAAERIQDMHANYATDGHQLDVVIDPALPGAQDDGIELTVPFRLAKLESLLGGAPIPKRARFEQKTGVRRSTAAIVCAMTMGAIAAGFGITAIMAKVDHPGDSMEALAAAAAEQQRQAELRAEAERAERISQASHDDLFGVPAWTAVEACSDAISTAPAAIAGWWRDKGVCDVAAGQVVLTYSQVRQGSASSEAAFRRGATQAGLVVDLEWLGTTANATVALQLPDGELVAVDQLPTSAQMGEYLSGARSRYARVNGPKVEATQPEGRTVQVSRQAVPLGYGGGEWTLAGAGVRWLENSVPRLAGVRLETLEINTPRGGQQRSWSARGTFLVQE